MVNINDDKKIFSIADILTNAVLKYMAFIFTKDEDKNKYLKTVDGWIDFSIGLTTEDKKVSQSIHFKDGKARVAANTKDVDTLLILQNTDVLSKLASLPPNEVLNLMLKNKMSSHGNMAYLEFFNLLISVMMTKKQIKQMQMQKLEREEFGRTMVEDSCKKEARPKKEYLKANGYDKGVKCITDDQYLSSYSLDDFPRIKEYLDYHHNGTPEICIERAELLTNWFRENGFETKKDGSSWNPSERQGKAFRYLMENKKAIIRKNNLLAGTTTTKVVGVPIYPDCIGLIFWGELLTVQDRLLNAYAPLTAEEIEKLNSDIFPYYIHRNMREYVREKYNEPTCQQLDERWAAIFMWKNVALSHTILDYPKLLNKGLVGIIDEIKEELKKSLSDEKKLYLNSMIDCYEGVLDYADRLAKKAEEAKEKETDELRKKELALIAKSVSRCPKYAASTLDEAVHSIWIHWIAVHMESTNAGFSIGRMDQWLQPYFEKDYNKLKTKEEKDAYVKHAIELLSCFYINCQDHLPLTPDIGNYLFGGSSSDQAITLGGITRDGDDAVNDMTYILLKVTEILSMRDPNVNARYNKDKNSDLYLKRLCEVNVNTTSTPSIHNDTVVMASLKDHNYELSDLRDWAATGCVEPTISGKHLGHTNCMMFSMVAPFEMAMNNGYHPLMRWQLGPKTGEAEVFKCFDDFFDAYTVQLSYMADLACEYNNYLGEAHAVLRPTPLMSAMIDGCIKNAEDCTVGGSKYNSSGTACIGLADVVDSLLVIKTMVYDRKIYTLREIFDAVNANFEGYEIMRERILNEVPRFGSDSAEAVSMANRVTKFTKECFWSHLNYRCGHYTTGWWSMSNHVAFGTLAGALPSGRLSGLPFTPGLTPESNASRSLLDNIKDVSKLNPENMNNNIAFNVKVNPSSNDTHEENVKHLCDYAKSYAALGGMQMQFNVVSSDTMRAAMANPDEYRDLMVRISGYNAYFVSLNKELQLELIRRADYGM